MSIFDGEFNICTSYQKNIWRVFSRKRQLNDRQSLRAVNQSSCWLWIVSMRSVDICNGFHQSKRITQKQFRKTPLKKNSKINSQVKLFLAVMTQFFHRKQFHFEKKTMMSSEQRRVILRYRKGDFSTKNKFFLDILAAKHYMQNGTNRRKKRNRNQSQETLNRHQEQLGKKSQLWTIDNACQRKRFLVGTCVFSLVYRLNKFLRHSAAKWCNLKRHNWPTNFPSMRPLDWYLPQFFSSTFVTDSCWVSRLANAVSQTKPPCQS